MKSNAEKTKKPPRYLRHPENGRVYPWTPTLAARKDLVPCEEELGAASEAPGDTGSTYPEERKRAEVMATIDKLRDAMARCRQDADEAPERIVELTEHLGEAVFRVYMGEVDAEEPTRIRAEIARLQLAVEDARYVTERATRLEIRLGGELQNLGRRQAKRKELLQLQDRLTKEPKAVNDESMIQRMRELSAYLDGSSAAVDELVAKLSAEVSSGSTAGKP